MDHQSIKQTKLVEQSPSGTNQVVEQEALFTPTGESVLSILSRTSVDQWNDLRVPFSATDTGPLRAPDFEKWRDNGAGSEGIWGLSFSATVEEEVMFVAQLPHTYKEGSRLAPHCHFLPRTLPTVGQTVRFGLEYTYANVSEVFPPSITIYSEYTFVSGDAQYEQKIGGFDPDIEDPTIKVSAMFGCRFFRDATHINDTYTGEVIVLEFDFHHLIDSFGTIDEFSK